MEDRGLPQESNLEGDDLKSSFMWYDAGYSQLFVFQDRLVADQVAVVRLVFVGDFGTRVVAGSFGFVFGFDSQNKRGSAFDKRERLKNGFGILLSAGSDGTQWSRKSAFDNNLRTYVQYFR